MTHNVTRHVPDLIRDLTLAVQRPRIGVRGALS